MMTWRNDAPPEGDDPIMLLAADDAAFAVKHGDRWCLYDIDDAGNPTNGRFAEADQVRGWRPIPRTPEEAASMAADVETLLREHPQRELAAAYERRDAIRQELEQLDQQEAAEARRQQDAAAAAEAAEQRRQDEAARQQQLHAIASGLVRGAT